MIATKPKIIRNLQFSLARVFALMALLSALSLNSAFAQITITSPGTYIDGADSKYSPPLYTPPSVNAQFTSPPNGTVVTSETFPVSQQICGSVTADGGSTESLSIMLVLDVSGSMLSGGSSGMTRIEQLRSSVKQMLGDLDASKTKVGIVQFGHDASGQTGASVVAELTNDFTALETALDGMYAAGRTPTGDGMNLALSQLEKYSKAGSSKYQVVASDGYWNWGVDPTAVATSAHDDWGQTVHTVGISGDHNVLKMQEIASAGGGDYFDATDPNNLDNIFGAGGGFVGLDSALLNGLNITSELNAFGQFCVERDIYEGANDFLLEGYAAGAYDFDNLTIHGETRNNQPPVPEPATLLLFGAGALALGARSLRRGK